MDEKIDKTRRAIILGAPAALVMGSRTARAAEKIIESTGTLAIERREMSPEAIRQAVQETATSLAEGISEIHGRKVNPRESGFMYHDELLKLYAEALELPRDLSPAEIVVRVKQHLIDKRIKIFPVTQAEIYEFQNDGQMQLELRDLARGMAEQDVGSVVYLSPDRTFQRIYAVQKISPGKLRFLESYPDSTSRTEPSEPRMGVGGSFTPLGIFPIPFKGVRLALLGEVTKVERPDLTRHFFKFIDIDGKKKPFVKNFNKSGDDEIVTVTGDTHLLWSPEIDGKGIKIHDTTELDDIGKPASSGCIRTPSARRFTLMTLKNKKPTQVLVYWAGYTKRIERQGWGGSFDIKTNNPPEVVRPRERKKKDR